MHIFSKPKYISHNISWYLFRPRDSQKSLNWKHLQVGTAPEAQWLWSFVACPGYFMSFMSWTTAPCLQIISHQSSKFFFNVSGCPSSSRQVDPFAVLDLPGLLGLLLPVEAQAGGTSGTWHLGPGPNSPSYILGHPGQNIWKSGTTTWTLPRTTHTVRTSAIFSNLDALEKHQMASQLDSDSAFGRSRMEYLIYTYVNNRSQ